MRAGVSLFARGTVDPNGPGGTGPNAGGSVPPEIGEVILGMLNAASRGSSRGVVASSPNGGSAGVALDSWTLGRMAAVSDGAVFGLRDEVRRGARGSAEGSESALPQSGQTECSGARGAAQFGQRVVLTTPILRLHSRRAHAAHRRGSPHERLFVSALMSPLCFPIVPSGFPIASRLLVKYPPESHP
jgi:hypothetical protein